MTPQSATLETSLARFAARLKLRGAVNGATAGLVVSLVALTAAAVVSMEVIRILELPLALVGVIGGAALGVASTRRRPVGVAREIERTQPALKNLLVTSAELTEGKVATSAEVTQIVLAQALVATAQLRPSQLWPLRRPLLGFGAIAAVWIATAAMTSRPLPPAPVAVDTLREPAISALHVVVVPPAYTGRPSAFLDKPSRIEALAGSRISLEVTGNATSVEYQSIEDSGSMPAKRLGTFYMAMQADADGFVALQPRVGERHGGRVLIGLTVTPDQPPRARITAPAKDLFISDTRRAIDLAFDAQDDLGLTSLLVRYTKVSGSGERFTFVEDTLPVTLDRRDPRHWTGRGVLKLEPLKLEAGDMVVYRAVARDGRPSAAATESDAWIIDITAPGMIAAAGFSMDDTENKYALSQQMVILKTERLIAKASSLPADSITASAQLIAAEQRAVRAEFVFMMGGEVAEDVVAAAGLTDLNEEAEAAAEADIAAGRLQNHGRVALVQSIRFMSRANTSLIASDLPRALSQEKAALAYLEQAFSRTRYLLRALTQRERLDLARRLTGSLAAASSDTRSAPESVVDPRTPALRKLLADLASVRAEGSGVTRSLTDLAQRVLVMDPADKRYQEVSHLLDGAGSAATRRDVDRVHQLVDSAALQLASALRADVGAQRSTRSSPDLAILRAQSSSGGRR